MFNIISKKSFSKADGTYVVLLNGQDQSSGAANEITAGSGMGGQCVKHSITVAAGDNTTGTIAFLVTPVGGSATEPLYEADGTTAVSMDLASAARTVTIPLAAVQSFSFTTDTLNGDDDVTVTISSGD